MNNPNSYEKQVERALKRKLELIEYKGGKCEKCGYCRNISALDFHHTNPSEKSFQLDARHLSNTTIDKLKHELDKCVLLCANCHREIHYPQCEKAEVERRLNESATKNIKVFSNKRRQSVCPHCGKEFDYKKGKLYCSKECRELDKNYPTKEEVVEKRKELGSFEKVALFYGLTRKILQGIVKNN